MTDGMVKWPEPKDYMSTPVWTDVLGLTHEGVPHLNQAQYERARADAAMARLKVAVEALRAAAKSLDAVGAHVPCEKALETLASIDMPEGS